MSKQSRLMSDERYWRVRAAEARTLQSELRKSECSRIMREIADTYDRLAKLSKGLQDAAVGIPPTLQLHDGIDAVADAELKRPAGNITANLLRRLFTRQPRT